jgi:hypothetical protein
VTRGGRSRRHVEQTHATAWCEMQYAKLAHHGSRTIFGDREREKAKNEETRPGWMEGKWGTSKNSHPAFSWNPPDPTNRQALTGSSLAARSPVFWSNPCNQPSDGVDQPWPHRPSLLFFFLFRFHQICRQADATLVNGNHLETENLYWKRTNNQGESILPLATGALENTAQILPTPRIP